MIEVEAERVHAFSRWRRDRHARQGVEVEIRRALKVEAFHPNYGNTAFNRSITLSSPNIEGLSIEFGNANDLGDPAFAEEPYRDQGSD